MKAAAYDNSKHQELVKEVLDEIIHGDLGDLPGVRKEVPAQAELSGGESCLYWFFNILLTILTVGFFCCGAIF